MTFASSSESSVTPPVVDSDTAFDQVIQQLETVRDFSRWCYSQMNASEIYYGHGTDNAWDEALQLVLNALNLPWDSFEQFADAKLTTFERQQVVSYFKKRVHERIPLPYLFNQAWFFGMPFYVDERVLIPRSPIAELIQIGFEPWFETPPEKILDMCTGSGCIGIACAQQFDAAEVDLVDLSQDALDVAQINVSEYMLDDRVFPMASDLFSAIPEGTQYDLIVSNPPYVDQDDFDAMPEEYGHEPGMALLSGFDGMDAPKEILKQAPNYLSDGGILVMEVGFSRHNLEAIYPDVEFEWVELQQGGYGVLVISKAQLLTLVH